jgi:hypothetical protein
VSARNAVRVVELPGLAIRWSALDGSGLVAVLVNASVAGELSSDRSALSRLDAAAIVGRALTETAMRPMSVVVLYCRGSN